MIRIVVSVAAFALAIMLVLVSGLRPPSLKSANQATPNQKQTNPSLIERFWNVLHNNKNAKQQIPSATSSSASPISPGQSSGQSQSLSANQNPQGVASPTIFPAPISPTTMAPVNTAQPANPREGGTQSPIAQPASPVGIPNYSAESTSSASLGKDRPPTSAPSPTTQPPVRGAW